MNKLTLGIPAGRDRPARAQRRGQMHAAATGHRPAPAQPGRRSACSASRAWNNPALNRYIGLCPEQDAFYEWMTGREFVDTCARLGGLGRARRARRPPRALDAVGMTEHTDRAVRGYSKGMRQRTKLAQALVHDPQVLFLDEPLTGTDPVARRDLIDIIQRLGRRGRERAGLQPRAARGRRRSRRRSSC